MLFAKTFCWVVEDAYWWDSLLCRFSQLTRSVVFSNPPLLNTFLWGGELLPKHSAELWRMRLQFFFAVVLLQKKFCRVDACVDVILLNSILQIFFFWISSIVLFSQTFCWVGTESVWQTLMWDPPLLPRHSFVQISPFFCCFNSESARFLQRLHQVWHSAEELNGLTPQKRLRHFLEA